MTTNDQDTVRRLAEWLDALEIRAAYQDETVEDLNKALIDQWARLDQALRKIAQLEERLQDLQQQVPGEVEDEPPPPHY